MILDASEYRRPYGINLTSEKQLLVEGQDDMRVFQALLKEMCIDRVQIHHYGGKHRFKSFMRGFVEDDNFEIVKSIGIHRDADYNASSAIQSVQDALQDVGLSCPDAPIKLADGSAHPKVAFIITPHERETGAIEDVCLESVENTNVMRCVNEYMDCLSNELSEFIPTSKARAHAYLSALKRPGLRLGEAAERGEWEFGAPSFKPLRDFLRLLYKPMIV